MILAGDEAQVQFAIFEVRPHLSGPRGSLTSPRAVALSDNPDPLGLSSVLGRRCRPARSCVRRPAGGEAGDAQIRACEGGHLARYPALFRPGRLSLPTSRTRDTGVSVAPPMRSDRIYTDCINPAAEAGTRAESRCWKIRYGIESRCAERSYADSNFLPTRFCPDCVLIVRLTTASPASGDGQTI